MRRRGGIHDSADPQEKSGGHYKHKMVQDTGVQTYIRNGGIAILH